MTARITYVFMPLLILPIFCPSRVFAAPADEMGVFILESIETEENEMELETVDMFWTDEIEIAEESGEVYDEVPGEDVYDIETSEVGSEMMPFLLEIEDDSDLASENAPVETDAFPELVLSGFEETEALLNASSSVVDSGTIGGSVSWELTGEPSSLTLTVRGEGAFKGQPWRDYRDNIVKVVIEDGITGIGEEAFYFCTKLKDITIPDSVQCIENRVFYECNSLKSVIIPEGVPAIKGETFWGCSSMTEVSIPESVTEIWSSAFHGCKMLTNVVLPSGLKYMGEYEVFADCSSLRSIEIPEGIDTIYITSFSGCVNMKSVSIPRSVKTIESWAFHGCGLTTVYYAGTRMEWDEITIGRSSNDCLFEAEIICLDDYVPEDIVAYGECGEDLSWKLIKKTETDCILIIEGSGEMYNYSSYPWSQYKDRISRVMIEKGAASIGESAFSNFDHLKEAVISDSVIRIEDYAFSGCIALSSVRLYSEGVTLGKACFKECTSLTSISLPEGVGRIPDEAFYGCMNLKKITVSSSVESIGSYAFYLCKCLSAFTFPEGVSEIDEFAFSECDSLETVKILEGITAIRTGTFKNCKGLKKITLPKSLILVESSAFAGCVQLSEVNYRGGKKKWNELIVYADNGPLTNAPVYYYCFSSDATVSLSTYKYIYDGKWGRTIRPNPRVIADGKTLIENRDYYLTYSHNKLVGEAQVIINGLGSYSGKLRIPFIIRPRTTPILSLTAGTKKFTVRWAKRIKQTDGYHIQYSSDKTFSSNRKNIKIRNKEIVSRTVSKLKAGKRYYVRIRCFKEKDGVVYYSKWSDVETVKTK